MVWKFLSNKGDYLMNSTSAFSPEWLRRPKTLFLVIVTFLLSLWLLFNTVCAVWFETNGHAVELRESIGKGVTLLSEGGIVVKGVLCAADPVLADGAIRFRVSVMVDSGAQKYSFYSVILDPWELGDVQVN